MKSNVITLKPPSKGRVTGPLDRIIGETLKTYRVASGVSQEKLAKAVGLTFQQIQKYEQGTNRLTVARFLTLAGVLGFNPGQFVNEVFEAKTDDTEPSLMHEMRVHLTAKGAVDLIRCYSAMSNEDRILLRRLAARLAGANEDDDVD